ncbi:MAG: tetratricopeptide repeat protein, partial [Planctomycetota bacterium]|nr:tetratricopeptide repeat protein [Planctomycetota bacterium]
MRDTVPGGVGSSFLLACLAVFPMTFPVRAEAPLNPDAAAMLVLDSARRAYNEGKCDFAAERFRDFLKQYGGHKEAPSAHYGLALSLLGLPQKDYNNAIASLQQVAGRGDFAERPFALYHLASAHRGLAGQALDQAAAKPNEAPNFRNIAAQQFNEAARNFAAAADLFAARVKALPATATPAESPDTEWLVRTRCDQCDMLLRLEKFKEAADLAQALLADKALAKSRYRELALYHLGYATFALRDYPGAGRALSQLAPFQQDFGAHARYLLSRTHHLSGERPEATAGYKALLAAYEQPKKDAAEAMKNPGALKPEQRARFEALLKGPPPEYILRASFYASLLLAEDGNFPEALSGFGALLQQYPTSPLADEVRLRQGYCQLQVRNCAEAIKVLQPLQNHPQLADRAMWWLARAQVGAADPNNAQAFEQAARAAADMLARAADKAAELGRTDPEAKARRADILLELGDTQQLAKAFREAAATYQRV